MVQYLEFDGYCPESRFKGEQVEMRLNEMDFWESEKTGLQMTFFPPFAAILQWRGEGKFRENSEDKATDHKGLLLARAKRTTGSEIFPDEKGVFYDTFDLEEYIHYIKPSYEAYLSVKFNPKDPVFDVQKERLANITKEQFAELAQLFNEGKESSTSKAFQKFSTKLCESGLIFEFNWMRWYDGQELLEDANADYLQLTLLEVSMLLTFIFRSDRFNPGTIKFYLEKSVIHKLINGLANSKCKLV